MLKRRTKDGPWYLVTTISGKRIALSSKTTDKKLATEWAHKITTEAYKSIKLDAKPEYTFAHVVEDWFTKHKTRKSMETMKQRVRWLLEHFGDKPLSTISRSAVDALMTQQKDWSDATRNRYVAEVSKLMKYAKALEWIDNVPSYRRNSEPRERFRWLTKEEAHKLSAELPEWLRELYWFALATGLREANVLQLEWARVDLNNRLMWVNSDQAKSNKTFGIPLNEDAVAILKARIGKDEKYVFTRADGLRERCSGNAWYAALKRAGLEGVRWHDLRHTWASWHAQAGTPMAVLQQLGGWKTPAMVNRYAHLSQSYLAQWAGATNSHHFGAASSQVVENKEEVGNTDRI